MVCTILQGRPSNISCCWKSYAFDLLLFVTVWAKTWHVCIQTEIHFIAPAYSYTKKLYMFTASTCECRLVYFSRVLFADHLNPRLVKWHKRGLQFSNGELIWIPLSVYVCLGFIVEYWPFVGTCTHHSYSKLFYLCNLALWLSFYNHPPYPHAPPTHPLYSMAQY